LVWACGLLSVFLGLVRLIHWVLQPFFLLPALAIGAGLAWLVPKLFKE
jgi:hypothetical protein